MSKELEIKLIEPIEAHYNNSGKNEIREIDTLFFKAPNYKHRDLTLKLRQDFLGAMIGLAKGSENTSQSQEQSDEDFDLDAKSIRHIITLAGSNFDAPSFYNSFMALFLKETCFKDEDKKQKVLSSDLNNLSLDDLDQIIVRYIEVFFCEFLDERTKIDAILCNLAYFYKGAASFEWLENQPLSRLITLNEEASKIAKELNKE